MPTTRCVCGREIEYTPEQAGKTARCPACSKPVQLPILKKESAPAEGLEVNFEWDADFGKDIEDKPGEIVKGEVRPAERPPVEEGETDRESDREADRETKEAKAYEAAPPAVEAAAKAEDAAEFNWNEGLSLEDEKARPAAPKAPVASAEAAAPGAQQPAAPPAKSPAGASDDGGFEWDSEFALEEEPAPAAKPAAGPAAQPLKPAAVKAAPPPKPAEDELEIIEDESPASAAPAKPAAAPAKPAAEPPPPRPKKPGLGLEFDADEFRIGGTKTADEEEIIDLDADAVISVRGGAEAPPAAPASKAPTPNPQGAPKDASAKPPAAAGAMKVCPGCGRIVTEPVKTCPECRAPLKGGGAEG
jgi:hypothetical protein